MAYKKRLLIIGAGEAAELLLKDIKKDKLLKYWVIGYVDDFREKGEKINDLEVLGKIDELEEITKSERVEEIIIAIPSLGKERLRQIMSICKKTGVDTKILPSTYEIIYSLKTGRPWYKPVREIKIEDLLRRKPSLMDFNEIKSYLAGKIVLITGGGGSIGSELCRQIIELGPKKLIILENNEYNLYKISYELNEKLESDTEIIPIIGDIKDKKQIDLHFKEHNIDLVFHAAAYKHVPLMETNVREAIKNNIFGTFNVVRAAKENKVKKFVLISTDKAVNPTSIMGATKKIAEMVIGLFDEEGDDFMCVRFGNVLGSVGSVIPLFEEQIEKGGPVTITHPEIKRYFMTIPEASQLVIQAGALGKNKEILMLDMGEQYKIKEIAEELIRLKGLIPEEDIEMKYIGLRPGEKLYEELFAEGEEITKTKHEKIFVVKSKDVNKGELETHLRDFKTLIENNDENGMSEMIKKIAGINQSE